MPKKATSPIERVASKKQVWRISVRQVTAWANPRYPFSDALLRLGYDCFKAPTSSDKLPLWRLAASDNADERKQFADLIDAHDAELQQMALTILNFGQLQPIEVVNNGKTKDGEETYTGVYGNRRCLAILYLWCRGLITSVEPYVNATLFEGNSVERLQRAVVENDPACRKAPNPVEEAEAFRRLVNANLTVHEVADRFGVSHDTVAKRLRLLELPPDVIREVAEGKLTQVKAFAVTKKRERGESVMTEDEDGIDRRRRMRPLREVRRAMESLIEGQTKQTLCWVLGETDEF